MSMVLVHFCKKLIFIPVNVVHIRFLINFWVLICAFCVALWWSLSAAQEAQVPPQFRHLGDQGEISICGPQCGEGCGELPAGDNGQVSPQCGHCTIHSSGEWVHIFLLSDDKNIKAEIRYSYTCSWVQLNGYTVVTVTVWGSHLLITATHM